MAHIDCSFYSSSLMRNVHVIVFLPSLSPDDFLEDREIDYFKPGKKFPVLYLLHGMYGDCMDWLLKTRIEDYAQAKGLAVVMPSGENSYYLDMEHGENFLRYVGEELPDFLSTVFPISTGREDTYISGLSMGGYGALRVGMAYPERFGRIASLSGVMIAGDLLTGTAAHTTHLPVSYIRSITSDPNDFTGTDNDLVYLAERLKSGGTGPLPGIYMTVGTEDFTLPLNEYFYERMSGLGYDVVYEKYPGEHNWDYWDTHIRDVLAWLP